MSLPAKSDVTTNSRDPARLATLALLLLGVVIRVAVLLAVAPFNLDRHFQIIQYINHFHSLPTSNQFDQSYQPPIYYLLMTPLYAIWQSPLPVHIASCVFSCVNLCLIREVMARPLVRSLVPSTAVRIVSFALLATLPEFVIFSSFISNDTLTFLLGTLTVWATLSYAANPGRMKWIKLACIVGIGLSTKGTFLLIGPALGVVMLAIEWSRRGPRKAIVATLGFCAIVALLGGYKFAENQIRLGHPIVHNQDNADAVSIAQRNEWQGWQTVYDINVIELIRRPLIKVKDPPSYPLLMYATFWYAFFSESSFRGNIRGYAWVGSILYSVAIIPTLTFFLGTGAAIKRARTLLQNDPAARAIALCMAMLLGNLVVVVAAGLKYNSWASFQSRLCFASIIPITLLFGVGVESLRSIRWAYLASIAFGWACVAGAMLYYAVELLLHYELIPRGTPLMP